MIDRFNLFFVCGLDVWMELFFNEIVLWVLLEVYLKFKDIWFVEYFLSWECLCGGVDFVLCNGVWLVIVYDV